MGAEGGAGGEVGLICDNIKESRNFCHELFVNI